MGAASRTQWLSPARLCCPSGARTVPNSLLQPSAQHRRPLSVGGGMTGCKTSTPTFSEHHGLRFQCCRPRDPSFGVQIHSPLMPPESSHSLLVIVTDGDASDDPTAVTPSSPRAVVLRALPLTPTAMAGRRRNHWVSRTVPFEVRGAFGVGWAGSSGTLRPGRSWGL